MNIHKSARATVSCRLAGSYGKDQIELACERALAAGTLPARYVEQLLRANRRRPFSTLTWKTVSALTQRAALGLLQLRQGTDNAPSEAKASSSPDCRPDDPAGRRGHVWLGSQVLVRAMYFAIMIIRITESHSTIVCHQF